MKKMFEVDGKRAKTWNPLGGECKHHCVYCWVNVLKQRYPALKEKYSGEPRIYEAELKKAKRFKEGDTVFVCDCCDLFGEWMPEGVIARVLTEVLYPAAEILFLTKNPKQYLNRGFHNRDHILGATIETDVEYGLSKAPEVNERITAMHNLNFPRKFISIEPILDFSIFFIEHLKDIAPEFVYIGYDNYPNSHPPLPEPPLEKTKALIEELRKFTEVRVKTLRGKR